MTQTKTEKPDVVGKIARFLWSVVSEFVSGIAHSRINARIYLFPGILVALVFVLRFDSLLAHVFHAPGLKLTPSFRQFVVYVGLFAGFFVWALEQAYYRNKVLNRLRDAFFDLKLEANRRLPGFIHDVPIDDHVRRMTLFSPGIPLKKFIDSKEGLEAHLNISIVKFEEKPGDKSRIQILYAMKGLAREVYMEDQSAFKNGEIPIGLSFEGPLHVNMRDVVHILVAGQTGGGKSNFMKVVTSTLALNNPEADVFFLDFKEGADLADLLNRLGQSLPNFHFYDGPRSSGLFLSQFGRTLEARLKTIAQSGSSTLDEYLKKASSQLVSQGDSKAPIKGDETLRRTYLVIDEIAQLYARDGQIPKEESQAAKAAVNRIARQGRAAGVHLIVATQKPDSSSFDQTVKANLPAVLCFPMASHAASVSALGSIRGCELNPEIKGRAVWKFGPKVVEVQTYRFQ